MGDHAEIIVIKRHSNHEEGHHGGAWKIAFADFMTAMMAFFLVLWIINATDKDTKTVIARYFNPVKVENPALATKGVHGVDSKTKNISEESTAKETQGAAVDPKHPPTGDSDGSAPKRDDKIKATDIGGRPHETEPSASKPSMSETELFSDPYRSLDKIVGRAELAETGDPDTADAAREAGAMSVDAFRDPFKPIGPGAPDDRVSLDADAPPPAPASPDIEPQKGVLKPAPAEKSSARSPLSDKPLETLIAEASHQPRMAAVAAELLKELQSKLGALAKSAASPAIDVQATDEGLLISLTDRLNFSMFAIGSAEPSPAVVKAMEAIGKILQDRSGAIVLRGHTDGRAYKSATYDNWRLSSARAQMAYYMLTRAGVPESRFSRVEGYANSAPKDSAHPLAAENRRIEILLRPAAKP
jgi:chemotaxis protein MotB